MKKFRSFLSVVLSSLFICFAFVNCAVFSSAAASAASPVIGIRYISPYGTTNGYLVGCVFKDDHTDFDYNDYYIKAYLQTVQNGPYYIKPYGDSRQITELSPDGTFQVDVTTGGVDEYAIAFRVDLHLRESGTVIDTVYISRPPYGEITMPNRKLPPADTGKPSNLPITDDKIGLCVGLYTQPGMSPNYNTPLTEEHIREQLTALLPFTDTVRFYGVDTETQKAYQIAQELGFNIIACANLGYSQSSNAAEIEALIDICNTYPNVRVALVGNEILLTNKVTTADLIDHIQYVKDNIPEGIAVSTADTVDTYFENSRLRSVVDLYYVHIYSYWSVGSKDASYTINRIEEFREAFCQPDGGKSIIIGETGLAATGESRVDVALDEESAVNYFTDMKSFCLRNNIKLVYFEAFDEPWKTIKEGSVGEHWGLLDSDSLIKSEYAELDFFKNAYRNFLEAQILPELSVYTEEGMIYGLKSDVSDLQKIIHKKNKCISVTCNTDIIGTDSLIRFYVSDNNLIAETRAVIFGDVNGDSWYDGTDSVIVNCLANGLLSREQVGEAVYMAADCNHDGVIDGADVALLEQAGIILAGVDQSKSPEELMTDSAYVEYVNLIKQSPTDETTAEDNPADVTPTDETSDEDNPADAALTEEPVDEGFNTSFIERLIDFISYIVILIESFFNCEVLG